MFTVFPGWEIDARNIVTCRPMQGIPDSLGFWIPGSGFQILCQWKLDFGFQSLVGFRIPWVVFRISKVQDSGFHKQKFHGSRNLDSVTWSKTCVRDRSLFIAGGGAGGSEDLGLNKGKFSQPPLWTLLHWSDPPNNFWWLSRPPFPPNAFIFRANLSGPPSESFQSFQRCPLLGSQLRLIPLLFSQKSSDPP